MTMSVYKLIRIGTVLALIVSINTLGLAQSKVLKQTATAQTEEATNPSIDPVEDVDRRVDKQHKKFKKGKAKRKGAKGKAKRHRKGNHPGKGHAYGKNKNSKEHKKAKSKTKQFTIEDRRERKIGSNNNKKRKLEKGTTESVRKSRKSIPTKEN